MHMFIYGFMSHICIYTYCILFMNVLFMFLSHFVGETSLLKVCALYFLDHNSDSWHMDRILRLRLNLNHVQLS